MPQTGGSSHETVSCIVWPTVRSEGVRTGARRQEQPRQLREVNPAQVMELACLPPRAIRRQQPQQVRHWHPWPALIEPPAEREPARWSRRLQATSPISSRPSRIARGAAGAWGRRCGRWSDMAGRRTIRREADKKHRAIARLPPPVDVPAHRRTECRLSCLPGSDAPGIACSRRYGVPLAEGVGFEPTVRSRAHTLSKRAP